MGAVTRGIVNSINAKALVVCCSKIYLLLEHTVKMELRTGSVRKDPLRTRGSVKSVLLPSPEEATPLGEVPCCGKHLKLDSTTPFSKEFGGTRVMTGSKGNNLVNMWQSAGLLPKCVIGSIWQALTD